MSNLCFKTFVDGRSLSANRGPTCQPMLLGAHSVGAVDGAAEVEHGEHGQDHHHALKQQRQLELLSYPVRAKQKISCTFITGVLNQPKRFVLVTRRISAGCWLRAEPGTPWWRSPQCCCSSGSPDTVGRTAGRLQTP